MLIVVNHQLTINYWLQQLIVGSPTIPPWPQRWWVHPTTMASPDEAEYGAKCSSLDPKLPTSGCLSMGHAMALTLGAARFNFWWWLLLLFNCLSNDWSPNHHAKSGKTSLQHRLITKSSCLNMVHLGSHQSHRSQGPCPRFPDSALGPGSQVPEQDVMADPAVDIPPPLLPAKVICWWFTIKYWGLLDGTYQDLLFFIYAHVHLYIDICMCTYIYICI